MRCTTALSLVFISMALPVAAEDIVLSPIRVTAPEDGTKADGTYASNDAKTATRLDVPAKEVPQAITSVTQQSLRDSAVTSLDEAVADVSGVTETNTIAGSEDAVIRRGFGQRRDGSLLTDGLKTVLSHTFNATTARVDVLKGPASVLYGVLDPGGMVNAVTKKPEQEQKTEAWTRYDNYGAGRSGVTAGVDTTGSLSHGLSYRFIAEREKGDYWRNFGQRDVKTVSPSLSWTNGDTTVIASYFWQQYDLPYDRGTIYDEDNSTFLPIDRRTRLDEDWSTTSGIAQLAKLTAEHRFSNDWKLSFGLAASRNDYGVDQARVTGYDSSTGTVTRKGSVRNYYRREMLSTRADLTGDAWTGGIRHQLLFGASVDREETHRSKLQSCSLTSLDVYDPTYGTADACTYDADSAVDEHEVMRTASIYMQDRAELTGKLTAVGGLRLEHYDDVAGRGTAQNTDSSGSALLPNVGLVYDLSPTWSLYASASQSFRPNSSITKEYGNLDPETGTSYEIGAKFESHGLQGTLALYTADKKNVAFSEVVDGETVYRTAGLVRARGIELDMSGALTDRLQMIASAALTDAKVIDDPDYAGNRLPNVARTTAALRLAYDYGTVPGGALRFGGGVRFVGARAGDEDNSFDLPAYTLADAFAAYTLDTERPVTVQLNVSNLFDKTYYASSIGNSAYGVTVGQPRTISLTVRVAF